METWAWIVIIIALLALALWIYAIADILRGSFRGDLSKILWLVVVIFFPVLGALLYLLFGRKSSSRELRR